MYIEYPLCPDKRTLISNDAFSLYQDAIETNSKKQPNAYH